MITYKNRFETILGMLYVLRSLNQTIHWNFIGFNFIDFHKYLDEVLEVIDSYVDEVAEDIRKNDMFVQQPLSLIPTILNDYEISVEPVDDMDLLIINYFEIINLLIAYCTETIEITDSETSKDVIIRLNQELEKIRWFLKSTFNILN